MTGTGITVVTTRSWVARELAANTVAPVAASFGLDAPAPGDLSPGRAWWMPAEHAARLLRLGLPITLSAPGPRWLSELPERFSHRTVRTVQPAELLRCGDGFCKPAEAKIDAFPAYWRTDEEIDRDVRAARLPAGALMQWTSTMLDLSEEWRCYVRDGRVVTYSLYLTTAPDGSQVTYYDGASCDPDLGEQAADFAATVAADRHTAGQSLSSYTLDVGWDRLGQRFVVVEANPTWCSAWYGCDLDAVAEAIIAACEPLPETSRWLWQPDAYLTDRAATMRPLPTSPALAGG